jgi:hypothetical protein
MGKSYLPGSLLGFLQWLDFMVSFVVPHTTVTTPSWPQITQAAMMAFLSLVDDFHTALQRAIDDPTSANRHERDRVFKIMKHETRLFVNRYLRQLPVTDLDRDQMGIPNVDTTWTLVPVPETYPGITALEAKIGGVITAHFHDSAVQISQAIPAGYTGCLANYAIGPEKITDSALLKEVKLLTLSPARMDFPDDEGKWLSIRPRWQLRRKGILGPPGPIEYVRIV